MGSIPKPWHGSSAVNGTKTSKSPCRKFPRKARAMPRRAFAIPAFLALAGCAAAGVPPQPQARPPKVEPGPALVASTAEILGNWDVVSFEGYEPAYRLGAFANFSAAGVRLRLECNRSIVPGIVREGRFVTQPGPRMQTEMGCGPEREGRDVRFFAFFDRLPIVELLTNGRLRLTAGETVLLLERPEQRRLAYLPDRAELNGKWRMELLTHYGAHGGESGIGLSEVPGHIVVDGNRLSYDRCPKYALEFTFAADGRLTKRQGQPLPDEPDCPALKLPWQTTGLPTPDQILPLLHGDPWVEEIGAGRLMIANEQLRLVLSREQ